MQDATQTSADCTDECAAAMAAAPKPDATAAPMPDMPVSGMPMTGMPGRS